MNDKEGQELGEGADSQPTPPRRDKTFRKHPDSITWVNIPDVESLEVFYRSILPVIRAAAYECGYAIGVHGSMRRDLDLIAVPWVETCLDKYALASEIQNSACGLTQDLYPWETKPHGRMATSIPVCWIDFDDRTSGCGHIDLSVIAAAERIRDGV